MAKQDIQTIIGSSISKDEILLKNFKSIKSCFVGWVESYNATSGTVNVQPAIQDYVSNDEQSGNTYRNSPLLVNVWVFGTFKSTAIEKGDKAVCFVLDQKSNDFFKSIYDSGISLGFQTFKPKTSARKSICDCVCVILGDASFQEVYEAITTIDNALENKADIDGTYPDMTVGNATNAELAEKAVADENGNVINTTYATVTALGSETSARQSADTTLQNHIDAKYTKPSTGIPLTDLSSSVQTTLGQVATNENNIADIVSGATVVGKAIEDGEGNNIANTYAKLQTQTIDISSNINTTLFTVNTAVAMKFNNVVNIYVKVQLNSGQNVNTTSGVQALISSELPSTLTPLYQTYSVFRWSTSTFANGNTTGNGIVRLDSTLSFNPDTSLSNQEYLFFNINYISQN